MDGSVTVLDDGIRRLRAIFLQVRICNGKVGFPYIVELMNTRMSSPYLDESIYLFLRKLGIRTIIIRVDA